MKATGATAFMYYFTQNTIGRWDLVSSHPSGWIDEWSSSLNPTAFHPTWFFKGAIYFGNANSVGSIYDLNGVITTSYSTTPGGLPLPADMVVTALNDDSNYLIIGLTKGSSSASGDQQSDTRIYFWDTISPKFNYEWQIPEYSIQGIQKFRDGFIAWGKTSMWYFNSSTKPTRINGGAINGPGSSVMSSDIYQDGVIWADGEGTFNTYGKMIPQAPDALFKTFVNNDTNNARYVNAQANFAKIYVGYGGGTSFGFYDLTGAGSTIAGAGAGGTPIDTIYMDLGDEINVVKADVWLAEPLAAGDPSDSLTVTYKTDEASSEGTFTSNVAFNTYGTAKRIELYPTNPPISDQLKLLFYFTAGNVKIKKIDLYGEPILRFPE